MGKVRKRQRKATIPVVDLGSATAESDQNLADYYVSNSYLDMARSFNDRKVFFVGDKGTGKSALLEMITREVLGPKIIRLGADEIGLGFLSNAKLLDNLSSMEIGMIYRTVWDYIILISIVKREFGTTKPPWWQAVRRNKQEKRAFEMLQAAGELEDDSMKLTRAFVDIIERIRLSVSATTPDGGSTTIEASLRGKEQDDLGALMSEIGLFRQISRLRRELPDRCKHSRFYVLIDDLDEGWKNTPMQRECLRALVRSLVKLQHFENVKFVVAIRKVIFDELSVDDPDKVRDHVAELSWTKENLQDIVLLRLEKCLNRHRQHIIDNILPEKIERFAPLNFMYSYLPKHPRAHIQFMQHVLDLSAAAGRTRVAADDFSQALRKMSEFHAQDLAFEYRTLWPGLDKLLDRMVGGPSEMSRDQMRRKMEDIFLWSIDEGASPDLIWLNEMCDKETPSGEMCDGLCKILVAAGILGVKRKRQETAVFNPRNVPKVFGKNYWFKVSPYLSPYLMTE